MQINPCFTVEFYCEAMRMPLQTRLMERSGAHALGAVRGDQPDCAGKLNPPIALIGFQREAILTTFANVRKFPSGAANFAPCTLYNVRQCSLQTYIWT